MNKTKLHANFVRVLQRRTERAVLWMGVPWTEEKPLREAASKREARFANGRGNLFGAVPEGLL